LRFAYAAIKINAELERIGDYAESIARQVLKVMHLDPFPLLEQYQEIANISRPMISEAVRSFLESDGELASQTMEIERKTDELRDQISNNIFELHSAGKIKLEAVTPLLTIARRFERATDQAKNICEEALYLTTGEYAKHRRSAQWRILFVDQRHSCLSRMAEAIGRSLASDRLVFESAGLDPAPPDPFAESFLAGKGVALPANPPRTLAEVPDLAHVQVLVSFGDQVKQALPSAVSKTVRLQWPVMDPSVTQGSPDQLHAAYESAFGDLCANIKDLAEAILGDHDNPS
jgi:protein-tyrosine-phosphatase